MIESANVQYVVFKGVILPYQVRNIKILIQMKMRETREMRYLQRFICIYTVTEAALAGCL